MSTKHTNIQRFLNRKPTLQQLTSLQNTPRPQSGNDAPVTVCPPSLASCPIVHNCCITGCAQPPPVKWICFSVLKSCTLSVSSYALDGVCDVEDKLHVHGSLGDTSTTSVDDGDQSPVQLVHVVLREQPASRASLVLHLRAKTPTYIYSPQLIQIHCCVTKTVLYHISLCGNAKRERVDAARTENCEVRNQRAAGSQSYLLLKHTAGRQD